MSQPNVQISCVSNLFVRMMHFAAAGDMELGHAHAFDHMTLLAKGSMRVTINGQSTEFTAPQVIFIKAELQHELMALSPDTVAYCIHALRDKTSGDIIPPESVPKADELAQLLRGLVVPAATT
jgi:quercetin dioxygenase-like cupin family protein